MAPSLKVLVARENGPPVLVSNFLGGSGQKDGDVHLNAGPPIMVGDRLGGSSDNAGPPVRPGSKLAAISDTAAPPDSEVGGAKQVSGGDTSSFVLPVGGASTTTSSATSTGTSTSTSTGTSTATAAKATSESNASSTSVPINSTDNGNGNNGFPTQSAMIAAIIVIGIIIVGIVSIFFLRRLRRKYKDPKYLPGKTLKNLWTRWEPGYQPPSNPEEAAIRRQARSRANIEANRALDRQTSVRSVITLPAYMEQPDEHERVLGRAGERDGLDTIVTFPETAEEEETRREERMQAMYELRLQRRAQAAEREARRQARTNSGSGASLVNPAASSDTLTTNMANAEAGGSRGRSTSDLTAAILNERQRRISEVSYSDLGVARSDGSRLRSSSTASNNARDSQPLLGQSNDNTAGSVRSRSGSVLSLDTTGEPHRRSSEDNRGGNDLGAQRLPPSYDGLDWGDAPPYMSPVTPVSRQSTLERQAAAANPQGESPSNRTSMRLPVVRVIGASNPNSPLEPNHPR